MPSAFAEGIAPLDANADGICDTDQTEGCRSMQLQPLRLACDFFSCVVPGCTSTRRPAITTPKPHIHSHNFHGFDGDAVVTMDQRFVHYTR